MNPNVIAVKAQANYQLLPTFSNSKVKLFDMKPYIDKGFFTQLQDETYFKTVHIMLDSIAWENGQDLSPDTLYLDGKEIQ